MGKEERPRLEPRILVEDAAHSHHAARRVSAQDRFDNLLIQGDNLLALKALEQEFAGRVKCIAVDPPYNTGSAFALYDDGVEHSVWLGLMRDRLEMFERLLAADGTLWIFLDDNEVHYLKVVCDEVFGRQNFVQTVVWQRKASPANDAKWLSNDHDYLLVYAKNKESWRPNRMGRTADQNAYYTNPDGDSRGPWNSVTYTCNKTADERPNLFYAISNPNTGAQVWPKRTAVWRCSHETHLQNVKNGLLYWGKDGQSSTPRLKRFLDGAQPIVPRSVWLHGEVGHTQSAMIESKNLFPDGPFPTPKTEAVVERILTIATNPGDLVLDSFLGSGTTAAVAHKMGRRWIGIELGDHAVTHCVPRLKKVIDGDDPGGITESAGWKGGGGFRFYRLAPSLLERDAWGNWVISREYNPAMLAEAVCKLEGFRYAPSPTHYWRHGQSTERDFIYVTTQTLTHDQLRALSDAVGPDQSLLVCCAAFQGNADAFENLEIKRMPHAVLGRCEWGRDDYSLRIAALAGPVPVAANAPAERAGQPAATPKKGRRAAPAPDQMALFGAPAATAATDAPDADADADADADEEGDAE